MRPDALSMLPLRMTVSHCWSRSLPPAAVSIASSLAMVVDWLFQVWTQLAASDWKALASDRWRSKVDGALSNAPRCELAASMALLAAVSLFPAVTDPAIPYPAAIPTGRATTATAVRIAPRCCDVRRAG